MYFASTLAGVMYLYKCYTLYMIKLRVIFDQTLQHATTTRLALSMSEL